MADHPVPWRRLWRRLDGGRAPDSGEDGFLREFPDFLGIQPDDGLSELRELAHFSCLALCGEPGMGKTTTLDLERPEIERSARASGGIIWKSFRSIYHPLALMAEITGSLEWADWKDSGRCLTIVVDGIDEGLALGVKVVEGLITELRHKPVDRLRLILVCRDADWPVAAARPLFELWDSKNVGRYLLQRLRRKDTEQALEHWQLSQPHIESFLLQVEQKGLEPLASRPITLRMLVQEYKERSNLSGSRPEIYRRACLRLLREDEERAKLTRQATGFHFAEADLYPFATRTATIMFLGRFAAVSSQPAEKRDSHHLDLNVLLPAGGEPRARAIAEAVIGSPLFSDCGNAGRSFAHQSFGEFLAAESLAQLDLPQLLNLVAIRENGKQFVAPPLAEIAAWLALMHNDFQNWLIANEPEILLRNDASSLSRDARARLVSSLLARVAQQEATGDLTRFGPSIVHQNLAAQLEPYLTDTAKSISAREIAIHLARIAQLSNLVDPLLAIAKNASEDQRLRERAMQVVTELLPADRLGELEPFANGTVGSDPDDELRGMALDALVPRHWSVPQALPAMLKPHARDLIGILLMAGREHIPRHIQPCDLPDLLRQLQHVQHPFYGHDSLVAPLALRTVVLAAQHLEQPSIGGAFVTFIRAKLRAHELEHLSSDQGWTQSVLQNPAICHSLADIFIIAPGMTRDEVKALQRSKIVPITVDDWPWLLQRIASASTELRELWAQLADLNRWAIAESSHRDSFFDACELYPELASIVGWPWTVELGSSYATTLREMHESDRSRISQSSEPLRRPSVKEILEGRLCAAERNPALWPNLAWELWSPDDGGAAFGVRQDLTTAPGWLSADESIRARLKACARTFLLSVPSTPPVPNNAQGWKTSVFWALWVLRQGLSADPMLMQAVVAKWFEFLVCPPMQGSGAEPVMVGLALGIDSERAIQWLSDRLLATPKGDWSAQQYLWGFEPNWDSRMSQALVQALQSGAIAAKDLRPILEILQDVDPSAAASWLNIGILEGPSWDQSMVAALRVWLLPLHFWPLVLRELRADAPLAAAVVQLLADFHATKAVRPLEVLSEVHFSELFSTIEHAFPSGKPLQLKEDEIAMRERVASLRGYVLDVLEARGSVDSCSALERLASEFPHWRVQILRRWRRGRTVFLRSRWIGVPVSVLVSMLELRTRRWVRSEDDLLELIVDSLRRFQIELNRRDQPRVRSLWNEAPRLRPKEEAVLRDEMARWLSDDLGSKNGAAVACEVELSFVHLTDIWLTVNPKGMTPSQPCVVCIEVKRHFNSEAKMGFEQQLVQEYLRKHNRSHGVYVVGWYGRSECGSSSNPLGASSFTEAQAAIASLANSVQEANPDLKLLAVCLNCEFPVAFRANSVSSK
jgi:hypothetical protein